MFTGSCTVSIVAAQVTLYYAASLISLFSFPPDIKIKYVPKVLVTFLFGTNLTKHQRAFLLYLEIFDRFWVTDEKKYIFILLNWIFTVEEVIREIS